MVMALELAELGMQMRLQRYRREHPESTPEEVNTFARAWLRERRGAPLGDTAGSLRLRQAG